jgi:hypothetical protein
MQSMTARNMQTQVVGSNDEMTRKGIKTLAGLWIVRIHDAAPADTLLLASVQHEVYGLAFSSAPKAVACRDALGASGNPFYVCQANLSWVVQQLQQSGARGFIVDYDAQAIRFASAHPLTA